jgi:hypothetical protein
MDIKFAAKSHSPVSIVSAVEWKSESADKIPQTIRINTRTAKRLIEPGKFGETFDDVISRVLDEREEKEKKKK